MSKPRVAVLRPDDTRIADAVRYLRSLRVSPIADPMLTICPTGQTPQQAEYCIFTSKTGVNLAVQQGWDPDEETVCAVGRQTSAALRRQGYPVDIIPSTFTSRGLVEELSAKIDGRTVEIARSAHGSEVLIQGLEEAGATVHESHLYRLERPNTAGSSVSLAIDGKLDGILFTSPKTVEHFLDIADDRDQLSVLQQQVTETIIGAIGTPTERALLSESICVDVKPPTVGFDQLADRVIQKIKSTNECS
ncbi:uroporphyrinogen-III synthase [Saliphagus infecundisoli]|uniref:Uroporphyrinogen-III synthase n=1 Tax=Saliphagus infecundisoli TaxID=1849069 RepID=A0ABD5QL27_9EURY|nr:uroporphyrinogen-III synthase [Saliphagus infecundisoli]